MTRTFFLLPVVALMTSAASAHYLGLDVWVHGADLIAAVSYEDGSYAQDAAISVSTDSGDTLFEGKTDDIGECRIPITEAMRSAEGNLRIAADAGMGHRATRRMAAETLAETASADGVQGEAGQPVTGDAAVEIRRLLRQELLPLRRDVASLKNRRPGMTEIIGGIGYVIGIAGLAAYIKALKKARG